MVQKDSQSLDDSFGQSVSHWGKLPMILIIIGASAISGGVVYALMQSRAASQGSTPSVSSKVERNSIAALGRLEPKGEIIRLSAPATLEGSRLGRLLVSEGDVVSAGQVVAILDTQERRLAALQKAQTDVQVARAKLLNIRSGKAGQIEAQRAVVGRATSEEKGVAAQMGTIARLRAELLDAQTQFDRFRQLNEDGAISTSELDARRLSVETLEAQLKEAEATLARLQESAQAQIQEANANLSRLKATMPTEIQVAEAELTSAEAAVKQAQADLELTYIRSPITGKILKVHSRPGEVIGQNGIAELGQTDRMNVVAQVYRTDISKVRLGQRATISSEVFSEPLEGTVSQVGLQVKQQDIFDTNPLAKTDNNVVDVRIELDPDSSQKVSTLSNLQVQVVIAQ